MRSARAWRARAAREPSALLLDRGQAREAEAHLEAVAAERAAEDSQGAPVEEGRLLEAAPPLDDRGQRRDVRGDRRVAGAEQGRPQPDRSARVRLGAREAAAGVLDAAEVVRQRGQRFPIAAGSPAASARR